MQATFTALERTLLGNTIHEEGATGLTLPEGTLPGPNLKPENEAAEALVAEYERSNRERLERLNAEHRPLAIGGDPEAFAAQFAKALADANAAHAEQMAAVHAAMAQMAEHMKMLTQAVSSAPAPAAPAADPAPAPAPAADPAPAAAPAPQGRGKAARGAADEPLT